MGGTGKRMRVRGVRVCVGGGGVWGGGSRSGCRTGTGQGGEGQGVASHIRYTIMIMIYVKSQC